MRSIKNMGKDKIYIGGDDKNGLPLLPGHEILLANSMCATLSQRQSFADLLFRLGLSSKNTASDIRIVELM